MLVPLLHSYLRARLPGSDRVTAALARRLKSLQRAPFHFSGLPTIYLDLRLPTSRGWLSAAAPEDWERGERELMRRWVRPGDVAYDIGANHGFHTAHLSRLVGPGGRVYAFEPNPQLLAPLAETCRGLGNAELLAVALAEGAGALDFYVPADHTMGSLRDWTGRPAEKLRVEGRSLDALGLPRPDFIKCDVEGAELDVFRGARRLLDREDAAVVLFEVCEASACAAGRRAGEAADFLASLCRPRYSFYLVDERTGSLSPAANLDHRFANLLAVPALRRRGL